MIQGIAEETDGIAVIVGFIDYDEERKNTVFVLIDFGLGIEDRKARGKQVRAQMEETLGHRRIRGNTLDVQCPKPNGPLSCQFCPGWK